MTLLAQYTAQPDSMIELALLEIETLDLLHVITAADASRENVSMLDLAHRYAAAYGHDIAEVDAAALFTL